jgi:hypothetical protein
MNTKNEVPPTIRLRIMFPKLEVKLKSESVKQWPATINIMAIALK